MQRNQNKIILVYPSYDPDNPYPDFYTDKLKQIPLGVFLLASYIKNIGYDVKLLDGRAFDKSEFSKMLFKESEDAFCVGFSVMTSQIKHSYFLSKELKKLYPDLHIVWGGIHPTLFTEQTIQSDYVDYVIYGEGEYSFEKLLSHLKKSNKDLSSIENLVWQKYDGTVVINPLGSPIDINALPDPDYSLLDMVLFLKGPFYNYFEYKIERLFDLITSRGCPYKCRFCATTLPAFNRWRPLTAKRVNNLIDKAVNEFNAKHIAFIDDLFFGNKKRIYEILDHIKTKKYDITWEAMAAIPLFKTFFTDDLLRKVRDSGCIVLGMGIESGSNRVLKIINKNQTVDSIMYAIRRCKQFDIIPKTSFITGIPGETDKESIQTIKLIARIIEEYDRTSFLVPSVFRPYPGTDLYQECIEMGFKEPKNLEEWFKYELHDNYFIQPKDLLWVKNPKFHINIPYVSYNYVYYKYYKDKNNLPLSRKIAGKIAELRIDKNFWALPYEYKFTLWKKKLDKKPWLKKLIRKIT